MKRLRLTYVGFRRVGESRLSSARLAVRWYKHVRVAEWSS